MGQRTDKSKPTMMKALATALISLIVGLWVVAIAILSIQNVFILDATGKNTLVSLQFLGMSLIDIPLGVILAVSAAIGMVFTGIMLMALSSNERIGSVRRRNPTRKQHGA